jgi:replicative DNA helicase
MTLTSLQIEKHVLNGLIQYPEILSEIEPFLNEKAFAAKPHDIIFSCIKSSFLNNEKIDKVLLAQKIKNLGISFKEDISIFDYIESISFSPITPKATIGAAKELVKLKALRDINETCTNIKKHIEKSVNNDLDKTISEIDGIYGEKINSFESNDSPEDLFADMYEAVEETGNNIKEETGLIWPYPEFNRMYGGARGGNIYAFASPSGAGKTTFLDYTATEMGRINKCPVLILDTEMASKEVKFRSAAAFTGIPLWALETGNWRKSPEYVDKVRNHLKILKNQYKVYHYHVGNKNVDELVSIIRRWYLSVVGRGNKCVVVYDYLKLTGEKLSGFWAEHQALGEKVDKFKRVSEEYDFPFLTAIQTNRSGENAGRQSSDLVDNGSIISQTSRLQWFCTYLGIFRRRTEDEAVLDTKESGTHKLVEVKARYQGKNAAGHNDFIKRRFPDGDERYVRNFINFNIDNFKVEERGSLKDSIMRQNSQFKIEDKKEKGKDGKTYILDETL